MDRDALRELLRTSLPPEDEDEDCPSADTLYRAVHGQLPLVERQQVVDHLSRCGTCNDAWQATRRTVPPAGERQFGPPKRKL